MTTVIEEHEITLSGNRYKILGNVHKRLINQSPVKSHIFKDFTRGMGKLERKGQRDDKYCWWTNCHIDHAGHMIPNPPATAVTTPVKYSPTGHTDEGVWVNETNAYDGNWATNAGVSVVAVQWSGYLRFSFDSCTFMGVVIKCQMLTYDTGDSVDIDYYDGSWHDLYLGDTTNGLWLIKMPSTPVAAVTEIRVRLYNNLGIADTAVIYEVYYLKAGTVATFPSCNFNSNTYFGINNLLYKINSSTGGLTGLTIFPANITEMVSSVPAATPRMAILLGDADELWYMSTAEAFTETDELGATYGCHWNSRFYWINSTGTQISYCTDFAAVLAETDDGSIPEKVTVTGLDVYQDAAGDSIIYARTTTGVWAHDSANDTFYKINVELASHSSTCKAGLAADGYYFSQGLHLIKYMTGNYDAVIDDKVGLTALDGVPAEYNAHIAALIPGIGCIYALYDSSLVNATGYSWVGKYNTVTGAWSALWVTGTVNGTMHGGILSDVYARRLWFDCGNSLYYIPVPTTPLFPKLVSGSTYDTGSVLITSWIEGDSSTLAKTYVELVDYAKSVTATETITIAYRTDRTYTDVSTGWTTLVTLDTTGENGRVATGLASGAGIAFNSFQLKITLARSTSTNCPDLQGMELRYIDNTTPKWAYTFEVNLLQDWHKAKEEMEADLVTAAESTTLIPFNYRDRAADTDVYVKVAPLGKMPTGEDYKGRYNLTLYEP